MPAVKSEDNQAVDRKTKYGGRSEIQKIVSIGDNMSAFTTHTERVTRPPMIQTHSTLSSSCRRRT